MQASARPKEPAPDFAEPRSKMNQPTSVSPPNISLPPPAKTPLYESTLLWGTGGVAVGIVISVLAASLANDLRWLLFAACPFFWAGFWAVLKAVSPEKVKNTLLVLLCALFTFGVWWLYSRLEPFSLTAQKKKDFTAILKTAIVQPHSTIIACPDADEDACAYANEFIPLFQRAGWIIEGPVVERVKLARTTRDTLIVIDGPALVHPQNPDEGVYTKLPVFEQPIKTALEFIGIHPLSVNDPTLGEDTVRIYFGVGIKR
jgi:hypothetical protein